METAEPLNNALDSSEKSRCHLSMHLAESRYLALFDQSYSEADPTNSVDIEFDGYAPVGNVDCRSDGDGIKSIYSDSGSCNHNTNKPL